MFYLLSQGGVHYGRTVSGIGIHNAMMIMYRANRDHWRFISTLLQASAGTVQAANDLDPSGAWAVQVRNAWGAVGVCDCPNQGDVDVINSPGGVDVMDVIQEIAIAFGGAAEIQDPQCPATRGDVDRINSPGVTEVMDVIKIIDIAFNGAEADNPCGP
jgi:hypothetical protein